MPISIEVYRREYKRQKKLETIVNSRILFRPNIKKWQVVACYIILPFLLFLTIFFTILLNVKVLFKIIVIILELLLIVEIYLRFCFIQSVKCYQAYAKDKTRRRCKCIPSCSEYAVLSLKTVFPLFIALIKIRKRLKSTCNGAEYKVDFPYKYQNKRFEKTLNF